MGGLDSATAQHLIYKAANQLKVNKGAASTPNGKGAIKTPYLLPNTPGNGRNQLSQSGLFTLPKNVESHNQGTWPARPKSKLTLIF